MYAIDQLQSTKTSTLALTEAFIHRFPVGTTLHRDMFDKFLLDHGHMDITARTEEERKTIANEKRNNAKMAINRKAMKHPTFEGSRFRIDRPTEPVRIEHKCRRTGAMKTRVVHKEIYPDHYYVAPYMTSFMSDAVKAATKVENRVHGLVSGITSAAIVARSEGNMTAQDEAVLRLALRQIEHLGDDLGDTIALSCAQTTRMIKECAKEISQIPGIAEGLEQQDIAMIFGNSLEHKENEQ